MLSDYCRAHETNSETEDVLVVSAVVCNSLKEKSATEGLCGLLEEGNASFEEIVAGDSALTRSVKS